MTLRATSDRTRRIFARSSTVTRQRLRDYLLTFTVLAEGTRYNDRYILITSLINQKSTERNFSRIGPILSITLRPTIIRKIPVLSSVFRWTTIYKILIYLLCSKSSIE